MKKVIFIVFIILCAAAIVVILIKNKAKIESKTKKTGVEITHAVTVASVENRTLDRNLTIIGITSPVKEVTVCSETQGRVKTVNFDFGVKVETGKILATVDDEIKRATLLNAEAALEKAKKDYERYETLNKGGSVNDAQLDAARFSYKSAQSQYTIALKQFNDTKIISPMSGFVTNKNIETGTLISIGTPIATIIDIQNIIVKVYVPEEDVFKLKLGSNAELETDIYSGIKIIGKIKSIGYKGDESHSYPVEVILSNSKEYPLKAGMFVNVKFPSIIKKECLVIPRRALIGGIKSPKVFLIINNKAKMKNVVVGEDMEDFIEILGGINKGDIVVTDGQINLKDNAQIKISK